MAVRLPGGSFTQAVDAGPAKEVGGVTISAEGVAHALISRPREPTSSSGSRSDAVLVTVRPGAAHPDAITLAGEQGLALARSAHGQLLAVTRRYDAPSGARLIAQVVDAAATAGPARFRRQIRPGFVDVLGAVLEPDGRAVVAWTEPDSRLQPIRVLVAEGNVATGFATPRRLGRDGQLSDARLAANVRGDAVIVWSAFGYRPRASLRPAGGTFSSPVIVSSLLARGLPTNGGLMSRWPGTHRLDGGGGPRVPPGRRSRHECGRRAPSDPRRALRRAASSRARHLSCRTKVGDKPQHVCGLSARRTRRTA